jgi:hypothetical protein
MSKRKPPKPPRPPKPPKPPKRDTRFKPGVSGNPKGRPRKVPASAQVREIFQRVLDGVVAHHNARPVTVLEAMFIKSCKTIIDDGRSSDFRKVIEVCQSLGLLEPPKDDAQQQKSGVLVVRPVCETVEEWERIYGEPTRLAQAAERVNRREFSSDDDEP